MNHINWLIECDITNIFVVTNYTTPKPFDTNKCGL